MVQSKTVQLRTPYLIFLGDIDDDTYGKTGKGLVDWCPDQVAGQIRLPGCVVDLVVPDYIVRQSARPRNGRRVFLDNSWQCPCLC